MSVEHLAGNDVRIVRDNQAVGDLLAAVESWQPLRFRSYEQGVLDTLSWLIDHGNVAPVTAKPVEDEDWEINDDWEDE